MWTFSMSRSRWKGGSSAGLTFVRTRSCPMALGGLGSGVGLLSAPPPQPTDPATQAQA